MFIKSAFHGENKWWQYLLTLVLVIIGVVIGQLPLLGVISVAAGKAGLSDMELSEAMANLDFASAGLNENVALLFMLLPFVFGLITLWLCTKYIHKKEFLKLINPASRINWKKFLFGFGLWMGITVIAEMIFWAISPEHYFTDFNFSKFFFLFLIAILILPLQTSFEEILFRGYLLQGLSHIGVYKWIPLLVTSIAFGAMHFMNPEVAAFGTLPTMVYYIGTGFFLGFITLMDDGLELALGVHAATNIFSALFVTFDDSALQTAAIFHTTHVNMSLMLVALLFGAVLFTLIVSRKYEWYDWTKWYSRIQGKTEQEKIDF